jgi:hypothetical protein
MSKDISITDLIAEARPSAEVFGSKTLYGRMFIALENARTTLDYDRDYIKMLEAKVDALEAVTVPTENEREALSLIISNAVGGGNPNVRAITDVTDAVLAAGFRLPVPVEPETQIEKRAEYKLVWGDGGERVSGDVEYFTRRMSVDHGDKLLKREITTTTSDWEEITEGGTHE